MDDVDILEHYGVKGMRWGVRRDKPHKVRSGVAGPGTGRRSYDPAELSNKELNRIVKRMELEQRYNTLNKDSTARGKDWMVEELKKQASSSVTKVAVGLAVGAGSVYAKNALEKKLGFEVPFDLKKKK